MSLRAAGGKVASKDATEARETEAAREEMGSQPSAAGEACRSPGPPAADAPDTLGGADSHGCEVDALEASVKSRAAEHVEVVDEPNAPPKEARALKAT